MRSRRTGSRSIRALPPTLPPAISTCARGYVESEKPRGDALVRTAQGVITTTDPLGSRSFFCLRARTSRTADGSKDTGVYCMSSWAMAKMLPMTRTARSPARRG